MDDLPEISGASDPHLRVLLVVLSADSERLMAVYGHDVKEVVGRRPLREIMGGEVKLFTCDLNLWLEGEGLCNTAI